MRTLWQRALGLLYAPTCCACGTATETPEFCAPCRGRIAVPSTPLCPRCGIPFGGRSGGDHPCSACLSHPPRFASARACAIYDAGDRDGNHPLKSVLQRYKYHRDLRFAPPLAQLVLERCPFPVRRYDVIVPVPLHLDRLRWRGFNQAQLLARPLARAAGVRLDPFVLQRVRATRPQVELNEIERQHNVAHAFRVTDVARVRRQRVLLFDDVYTTGATVSECAKALRRAGAQHVDVMVLARAVLR